MRFSLHPRNESDASVPAEIKCMQQVFQIAGMLGVMPTSTSSSHMPEGAPPRSAQGINVPTDLRPVMMPAVDPAAATQGVASYTSAIRPAP